MRTLSLDDPERFLRRASRLDEQPSRFRGNRARGYLLGVEQDVREAAIALEVASLWQRTLVMTYSEFGRRARENGSAGTDHGTAAPHFLLGGRVKGGLYGRQPSLRDLVNGDLRHHLDYRQLYASVARLWWGFSTEFLDRRIEPVAFLR